MNRVPLPLAPRPNATRVFPLGLVYTVLPIPAPQLLPSNGRPLDPNPMPILLLFALNAAVVASMMTINKAVVIGVDNSRIYIEWSCLLFGEQVNLPKDKISAASLLVW